jgi:hypothetical protein
MRLAYSLREIKRPTEAAPRPPASTRDDGRARPVPRRRLSAADLRGRPDTRGQRAPPRSPRPELAAAPRVPPESRTPEPPRVVDEEQDELLKACASSTTKRCSDEIPARPIHGPRGSTGNSMVARVRCARHARNARRCAHGCVHRFTPSSEMASESAATSGAASFRSP